MPAAPLPATTYAPNWSAAFKAGKRLEDKTDMLGVCLQKTSGVLTHFSSNGNTPSIIDLTITGGHMTTIAKRWSCDTGKGGDSDRAATTTLRAIHL